ncbi:unnamed protein product [Eretmochelys imbricata]
MMSCGLLTNSKEPVPLHRSSVSVLIRGFVADMGCQLLCRNEEPGPVESVFKFPVDAEAAVDAFQAWLQGAWIQAQLQEKREAQELYGDGATRYVLPTVLHPRYTPHRWDGANITQEVPRVLQGELPYTLSRSTMLQSPHSIDHVLSNCPLTPLSYTAGNLTTAQVSLAQAPPWDRELELLVYYTEPPKPSAVLEAGLPGAEPGAPDGRPGRDDDPAAQSARGGASPEPAGEFILLLGRSGSTACPMDGRDLSRQRINSTKGCETLVLLLKSLPLGCYFNIYGFGSEFQSLYPQSVENTQQTKAESLQRLRLLQANLGGTEILEPLRAVYRSPCRDGHPRQLFVFTDGEVENTQDIIAEDPQVLLLRHWGQSLHGSDQRHCSGSRGQHQVHHRTGPHAAQGAAVSEVGPAAGSDRDLTELGSAPWDPGGAAALGPRGDLCWAAVPCLRPAPRAAPAPRHSHGGHHPAVSHPGPDLLEDVAVLPAATGWRQRLPVHRLATKSLLLELERAVGAGSEGDARRALEASLSSGIVCSLTAYVGVDMERGQLVRWDVPLAERAPEESPLLRLVSLQNTDVLWNLDPWLAAVLGVSETDARGRIPSEDVTPSIWATVLAMVWLHDWAMG